MSKRRDKAPPVLTPARRAEQEARRVRLAAQLRTNLRKRKAQQSAHTATKTANKAAPEENGG